MKDFNYFKKENSYLVVKIRSKQELAKLDLSELDCIIFDSDEKEARRIIESVKQKNKKMLFAIICRDDEFNRRALETLKINFLVSPERTYQKDTLKQSSSGLNHVMIEIAKKNKIEIISDLSFLNDLRDKKSKSIIFGRLIQNIKILRKAGLTLHFANFAKSPQDLWDSLQIKSLGFSLGMSSQQVNSLFSEK